MGKITAERLRERIQRNPGTHKTPLEDQKKTLAAIEAEPRLAICENCEGERGYINIVGFYVFCRYCRARGVCRRRWWHFHVPLPPGELDGIPGAWS
jgi:hypothetical protein